MQEISHPLTPAAQSLDVVYSLLSNPRRREAVAVLAEREPPADLRELGAAVAARETGVAADSVPDATTHAVATVLHHVHLPKLDDAGVVEYDHEERVVTSTADEALGELLDTR